MATIRTKEARTQRRAYQIWEAEGRPQGRDFDHWLKAEAELSTPGARSAKPQTTPRLKAGATKAAAQH